LPKSQSGAKTSAWSQFATKLARHGPAPSVAARFMTIDAIA
jgi:hypothetical protein